ncbi:MAG: T9SS type A sorting domain-containing protein [Bacteroidales bacterium]|nr:T9SS type A sorting domain-containing protein [Bacteroidales bacterium]
MEVKSLQINILALLFGFAALCFVSKAEANNAIFSAEEQLFSDPADEKPNQKPTKRGSTNLFWDSHGPIDRSGLITSVVHNSSDSKIVYVGAAHNGVWKSTDGTAIWNQIPVENDKNLYVTCLALDEAANAVYAGTGGEFAGQGIYRAEGNGALKLMPGTEGWGTIYKIAVSGNRVYAATHSGLMCYSGGAWKVCTGTDATGGSVTLNRPVKDISINKSGLIIIAGTNSKNYLIDCYISKTGAPDDFEDPEVDKELLAKDKLSGNAFNISVTTSPVNDNVLYVVASRDFGQNFEGKVYRAFISEDKGNTWEVILEGFASTSFIDPLEGNGKNLNTVYADPIDPYTIYIVSRNIWKGTRHSGHFDFGLSAISYSIGLPESHPLYLHSNIRALDFFWAYGDLVRGAYVATDGGVYRVSMEITPHSYLTWAYPAHRFLPIGSYNFIGTNGKNTVLGTPTLGVQAMDTLRNFPTSARYIWDIEPGTSQYLSEGRGGACAVSSINEDFYIYSQSFLYIGSNNQLVSTGSVFRRTVDNGITFQPLRSLAEPGTFNANTIEWFSGTMLGSITYDVPIAMWESFDFDNTPDTVWFKADNEKNFIDGDQTIFAPSKNAGYPIAYPAPAGFASGDSIQVPDPVQNKFFIGLGNKIFMTREALDFSKTRDTDIPIKWFELATLNVADLATAFALSDDANTLYVGTVTGKVFCFTNLRQVYDEASLKLVKQGLIYTFTGRSVHAMSVDPTDSNHLVVVLKDDGNNVYETFDGEYIEEEEEEEEEEGDDDDGDGDKGTKDGSTFTLISNGLPNTVYSVLFPKGAQTGTLLVGTELGLWMRENGSTWTESSNGIGKVPVTVLTQVNTYRPGVRGVPYFDVDANKMMRQNFPNNISSYLTIYAGTYGSGIFTSSQYVGIQPIEPTDPKESNSLVVTPNPVNDMATINLDMTKGRATIQIFNVDGRLVNEQVANSSVATINFKNYASGTYIIQVNQGGVVKSAKVIKK